MTTPLISVSELSDYAGISYAGDNGGSMAVDMASEVVRQAAEQDFTAGTSTITLDGSGTDAILLPQLPVGTITLITIRGGTVDPSFYTLRDDGVVLRTFGTAIGGNQPLFSDDWQYVNGVTEVRWPRGRQNIAVTYTHGGSVPEDVRMVCLAAAHRFVTQGAAISEGVGDASVRYAVNSTDLTRGEQNILRKHKPAR